MYKDFIAGWAAGGAGLVIGHPLDTVKARLQTIKGYNGLLDCLKRTFREESVFGLYKGLWIPFLSTGALHSLLFVGYGFGLKMLHPGESNIQARKDLPMSDIMLASICGTMAQVGPAIPVELIKTRLQGGNVLFLRDSVGYLFYIPVYELSLRYFRQHEINETTSQLISGGCAGVLGWWSICPLEVVKNHIQVDKSGKNRTMLEVARKLWNEGGFRSFYTGGLTLAVRGFIVNSTIFLVYENILLALDA